MTTTRGFTITLLTGLLLLSATASTAQSTKDEARARRAEARRQLKEATALYDKGQYDAASTLLDSLVALDPRNADGFYYKGLIGLKLNDTSAALEALSSGIAVAPLSTRLKLLKSRTLFKQGSLDESAELVNSILRIKPKEPKALYLSGLISAARADTSAALDALEKALNESLAEK